MADERSIEERVIALVEAYGSEPGLWPEAERTPSHLACLSEPGADLSAVVEQATLLDDLLSDSPSPAPDPALTQAVLSGAPKAPLWRRFGEMMPHRHGWFPATGAFASLAVGIAMGLSASPPVPSDMEPEADEVLYAALGYTDLLGALEESVE